MPFYLKDRDILPDLVKYRSVLIVPCRFCPAASSAVRSNEPYIELFRGFFKTAAYERMIRDLKANLEEQGVRTRVFKSTLLHQFVLCFWSSKMRQDLLECARQYDALLVLGCEAAVQTVKDAVGPASCEVIQGMETEGLMSVQPLFRAPCSISLALNSITPVQFQ
jgi:hypothetical protein